MEKPSVLVFIDWYYPGFKAGGPVRSCLNMVGHMKHEFDFYIVTRNTEYTETVPYIGMEFNKWLNGPNEERVIYLDEAHQNENFYMTLLDERDYQTVMIMGLFSNLFSILPLKAANKTDHPNIIVSPRGMLAPGALKIKPAKKKLFLSWANLTGLYRSVNFHVTNENEEQQVKKNIRKFHSLVVADNFPRKMKQDIDLESKKESGKLRLVSVARIAPEKNILFALEIISQCKSEIEFDLFGSIYDSSYWDECKSLMDRMPSNIKVNYKGDLHSDSLFEILPQYDFLFLPTRGENFGHIILEAFMCGLPVIISDKTPWKNLETQKIGFDIPLDDANRFVNIIDNVSQWNSIQISEWKNSAFQFARTKSDVSELKKKYISFL
jgi:glycosyltransferase involved in cell wall biosynthesis